MNISSFYKDISHVRTLATEEVLNGLMILDPVPMVPTPKFRP